MTKLLSEDEIMAALGQDGPWQHEQGKLVNEFRFERFSDAFAFITRVALLAEKTNHHPDLYNSYTLVRLELHSHDAGGVTKRDIDMAKQISELPVV